MPALPVAGRPTVSVRKVSTGAAKVALGVLIMVAYQTKRHDQRHRRSTHLLG
jgi:hypothetical protein